MMKSRGKRSFAGRIRLLRQRRRGAVIPLFTVFLIVLLTMAVFTVDIAYMQLTRTELRAATDAAAKAGAEALARHQDQDKAIQAAISLAAQNTVAGRSVVLRPEDVIVGSTNSQADGSWAFTAGGTNPNAVRVNSKFGENTGNGSISLFFAGMFGKGTFAPTGQATAASLELEICLAIDRSHSMCFDLSGADWTYPPGTPTSPHPVSYPPHTVHSRWAHLDAGVKLFLDSVAATYNPPRVSLITWGSDIGTNTPEFKLTGQTAPAVSVDTQLSQTFKPIRDSLAARGDNVMLGATNMSAGMDAAVHMLNAPGTKPYARKYMILMTDGIWNHGRNPLLAAQDAAAAGITVHVVTFLSQTDQTAMRQVAEVTGGRHYHAHNGAELRAAFQELARSLPVVLTD